MTIAGGQWAVASDRWPAGCVAVGETGRGGMGHIRPISHRRPLCPIARPRAPIIAHRSPLTAHRPQATAFTLAEVLFAMAILSFALLSIIGLMPSTLASLNDAEVRIAEARIVQSVNAEFQLAPWDMLPKTGTKLLRYYDQRGVRSSSPGAEYGSDVVHHTEYAVAIYAQPNDKVPVLPGDSPGAKDKSKAADWLRSFHIVITRQIQDSTALQDQARQGVNRVYAITVANQTPQQNP